MNDALPENVRDMDAAEEAPVNQADLQGFLLKIAVGGITVQDYVKR